MAKLDIRKLAEKKDDVFVSIYLPTHRNSPENKQDRIRFKNLLTEANNKIKEKFPDKDIKDLLKDAENLYENVEFWNQAKDGLAVLIDSKETEIIRLEGKIPEKVVVGERFHLLPLLNYYEFLNERYILDVSRDRFKLYYADQEGIEKLETPGIEQNFTDLYDDKDIQSNIQATRGAANAFHGHKSKPEIDEVEREKYLRYISKGLSGFFKDKDLPIALFGTTEVVTFFKEIAKNELNITKVIDKPLVALNGKEIFDELKEALMPGFKENMEKMLENLNLEVSRDKGTDNASRITQEAKNGRIETLFTNMQGAGLDDDKFDELVQDVLTTDGKVVVIDENINEFPMGMGAIYRY